MICKNQVTSLLSLPFIALIKLYQLAISPFLGNRCRFYPSCSNYALDALKYHLLPYALWLIVKRILRCQPLCKGGFDPIPLSKENKAAL